MNRISSPHIQAEPIVYKSPGLQSLLDCLQGERKHFILDLGQALGANVEFWSQFNCRLYIEDFYRCYTAKTASRSGEPKATLMTELLPIEEGVSFDIILTWDLFNYLEMEELEALVQRLNRWCRRGTQLLALISSLPQIPAVPAAFRILDAERVRHETHTQETQPCPRHQPRDISKLMSEFDVLSSFLLRNGIQEYVFAFRKS